MHAYLLPSVSLHTFGSTVINVNEPVKLLAVLELLSKQCSCDFVTIATTLNPPSTAISRLLNPVSNSSQTKHDEIMASTDILTRGIDQYVLASMDGPGMPE